MERLVFCVEVIPVGNRDVGADGAVFSREHGAKGQQLLCSEEVELASG